MNAGLRKRAASGLLAPNESKASIYVVDDGPFLTELYTGMLGASGYRVRAFNDRVKALAAFKADWKKPDLLIMDYCGLSMPVEHFLHQCLLTYPALRILMLSGFRRAYLRFSGAKPDRLMEKPFTREEFQREVKDILAT